MADPMTDRLPPHSRDAEEGVIGGLLRDPDVLSSVLQIIRAENFYFDAHQKVFQAVVDLYNDNQPIDLVLIHERLRKNKQLDDVGGAKFLAELWERVPTGANAEYHARIVRDTAMIRSLIHAGNEVLRDAYDRTQSADELVASAERKVMEIARAGMIGETKTLSEVVREAFDRIDARVGKENLEVSGLSSGYTDLDNLTAGFQKSELTIIAARPAVGKCVTADTEVVAADGSVTTIEELFRRGRGSVLTLADNWTICPAAPSAFVDDGLKPVFRVRTQLGRVIETTASHPFRTLAGWVPLARLAAGDHVAVPRRLPAFGTDRMRDCEVRLLGYLIGDGGLSDTCPEFTNSNPRVRADFEAAVRDFGGLAVRTEDAGGSRTPTVCVSADPAATAGGRGDFGRRLGARLGRRGAARELAAVVGVTPASVTHWRQGKTAPDPETFERVCAALRVEAAELAPGGLPGIRKNGRNALTRWLESLGLWGKTAREKFVPAPVFRLPREQLAVFVNRLFATDGWATVSRDGSPRLGFTSASERLARQVQHLLLRFGVVARLRHRAVKYRGTRRDAWQLDVTGPDSVRAFATDVGMFGKEEALGRAVAALAGRGRKATRDVIPSAVWDQLAAAKGADSWAAVAARAGYPARTYLHVGTRALSRRRLARLAAAVGSVPLQELAAGDVYWDRIVSVEPVGRKQVYDLTVPDTHNFVANDVCVHNTAFALNVIRHMITEEMAPVLFVSLEMARVELAERLLACQSRVDSHKIRKGHLNADDIQKLMDAGDVLRKGRLYIDDTPNRTMLQIGATARRLMKKEEKNGGLRAVVVDYLQLIEPENRRDPRQEQVAQISRRLKILARELLIPVVALAQVNRGSEDRQDHKPRLSDLRESGSIEQDADTVLMLHRPSLYDKSDQQLENVLEIIIAKQRNGPTGEVTLTYLKQYMRYENYIADVGYGGIV